MRLVIDMQGAQTASRFRGIGRYTLSLVQEMARQRGEHEILLALNAAYAGTIEPIRAAFADLLPADAIKVYEVPSPTGGHDAANDARRKVAERMVDAFFASLKPDVIFIPSLFEEYGGEAVTSVHALHGEIPTAVTLHDLIPLIHHDVYLQESSMFRWYYRKIDHLRRADLLLAVSDASGREGVQYLNMPESGVVTVPNACDVHFHPISLSETQHAHLISNFGIDRPFIMNTGGTDFRKNIDGLFRAFASLPSNLRSTYALALVGREVFDQKDHFLALAKQAGLQENDLIFTGYVSDADLALLYNACTLLVFPSWHEGFGLPVLEAMACGTAVIAANSSSLPEVVGRQDALFAPRNDADMAAKMAEVLQNLEFREELERHGLEQAKKFSWFASASRAWAALSHLQAEHSAQKRTGLMPAARRPKLAFVSPLPPEKTGIADYSAELLPELARHYDITVIVQQEAVSDAWAQANAPIQDAAWLRQHAHEFDRVLYQMGNSDKHIYMFALMEDIPGVLVLHDFFLSGLLAWCMEEQPAYKNAWTKALYQSHGWCALQERFKPDNAAQVVTKWPCNLAVLQQALGVIVHSDFSRQLAKRYYGDHAADGWSVIPLLHQIAEQSDRSHARESLNLLTNDFVICSFGALGESKLNHRLLDAWLASPLSKAANCRLVFVGESQGDDYGHNLTHKIAQSTAKDRIVITGWASDETYRTWLAAADMGVQLRSLSLGETSGTVLDCMNYGLSTIVNAHGSMAELPTDAVWLLPDTFSDAQLIEAITTLWQDATRRAELGAHAKAHILSHHSPRHCADQYAEAIEAAYAQAEQTMFGLMQTLPQMKPTLPVQEYPRLADVLSANFPPQPRLRQLLLDISELAQRDAKTGIQRVTRALMEQMLLNPPAGWSVQPVYATADRAGYRYARRFTSHFLNVTGDWAEDAPVQAWAGDVFFGLDFQTHVVCTQESTLHAWRNRGVAVYFVVYDLLPVLMPEVFPAGAKEGHQRWLKTITQMDGALCISRSVADELHDWLQVFGEKRKQPLAVDWFHLGADVDNSNPTRGLPSDAPQTLRSLTDRPSFLIVGTIEPRKGVLQTLHAFDQLWAQGVECNLVIVGKEGWKPVPEHLRGDIPQTVQALQTHPELGKRLFWLEAISDEYLEQVYAASTCLIAASYGEGFGLPLIEAARHGLPIVARDIPVFREVTDEQALFFNDSRQPEVIAQAISEWLALYRQDKHPRSDALPHLTWAISARNALDIILGNTPPYRTWLPDGVRRYWGADPRLSTEVGKYHGTAVCTTGKAGHLIFGPYERYEAGSYRILIQGRSNALAGNEFIVITASQGKKRIAMFSFLDQPSESFNLLKGFDLEQEFSDLEVGLWVSEKTQLTVTKIEIKKMDTGYDFDFSVVNKSYLKDLHWSKLLYQSWMKFSTRNAPYFIIVPRHDVPVFNKKFSEVKKSHDYDLPIILAEEDVLNFSKIICPENFDGWRIQQIIKLCFSKTGFAKNYITLDSAMIFSKPFDYNDLYSDDGIFYTAAQPVKKPIFFGNYREVDEKGWLNGQLVNLSESLGAICKVMGNESVDTHWYIAGNGFFDSELCKELESFAVAQGLNGLAGLIGFAPYEFAWYGEYVFMKQREKFRPKYPLIMHPCIEISSLSDLESGNLTVPEDFYGFLFQPPASEHLDLIVNILEKRRLL
jgi:glycosyltransferase involved in cell wall biosynthesis